MTEPTNPFLVKTDRELVAIKGLRYGYLQLDSSSEVTEHEALPMSLFVAAQNRACRLERQGAKRVYWITLSEQIRHLHIHLFPRWSDQESKGLKLFERRNNPSCHFLGHKS